MDAYVGAPAKPARWCRWSEIEELFRGPADIEWERDRELVNDELRDFPGVGDKVLGHPGC